MTKTILIMGGYGVFGGRLALALSQNAALNIIVAGRNAVTAEKFCKDTACTPLCLDRNDSALQPKIEALTPFAIIDATGPFQAYDAAPYRLVEIAIQCGAHYLDLSDDAAFTQGITTFNARAVTAQVTLLSGVSSVPALSSAVVGHLRDGLDDIHLIETIILPGNRAPRGLSVIRAIIAQVGNPMEIWRGSMFEKATGLGGLTAAQLSQPNGDPKIKRWASFIGAPDLELFPDHFRARSVIFKASLDLKLMHGGLWLLSWLVRLKLMRSLLPLTRLLKMGADVLEPYGSDIGGMTVEVSGKTNKNTLERRRWELLIKDGHGPHIPTVPAQILVEKLVALDVPPGARPCLEAFSIEEAENKLSPLSAHTQTEITEIQGPFQHVLGQDFKTLPLPLQDLHTVIDVRRWQGRARVIRGHGILSRLAGWLVRFPPASDDVLVSVEMRHTRSGEVWKRQFGRHKMRSIQRARQDKGVWKLYEHFGPLRFHIDLQSTAETIEYPVRSTRFLGIPIPAFLCPKSESSEQVDAQGRATFSVNISLPIAGHVVSYSGWLEPID